MELNSNTEMEDSKMDTGDIHVNAVIIPEDIQEKKDDQVKDTETAIHSEN